MAKINARGAREVARWEAFIDRFDRSNESDEVTLVESYRYLFLLRSDGKVLRRLADKDLGGTYSIFATFKPTDNKSKDGTRVLLPAEIIAARKARVERMLTNKGYRWAAQAVRV